MIPKKKSSPDHEALSAKLAGLEVLGKTDDDQYEYEAIAQFFDKVNDRLMMFRKGAFTKTASERVPKGRVKITDGHISTGRMTLGTVIEAEERKEGLWYKGRLSASEAEFVTKMREGHVDENSIEFVSLREGTTRVPLDQIPAGTWLRGQEAAGDGTIEVREILEVVWFGISLLPYSAQGERALVSLGAAVPFQDLPVAAGRLWDPDAARARVLAWAGTFTRAGAEHESNLAKLSRAYLSRSYDDSGRQVHKGLIADVVGGRLVIVPDALHAAAAEILTDSRIPDEDKAAALRATDTYLSRARGAIHLASDEDDDVTSDVAEDLNADNKTAGPTSEASPTADDRSDKASDGEVLAAAKLRLSALKLSALACDHPEVTNEPARPGGEPA